MKVPVLKSALLYYYSSTRIFTLKLISKLFPNLTVYAFPKIKNKTKNENKQTDKKK